MQAPLCYSRPTFTTLSRKKPYQTRVLPTPTKKDAPLANITFEPFYRVVLIYSEWENDKSVAQKVKISVPIISGADALSVTKRAKQEGRAIVVTVIKEDALTYMNNLRRKGLITEIDEA